MRLVLGNQTNPAVASLSGGGFVATWQSDTDPNSTGVYGRRFTANGTAVDTYNLLINTTQVNNQTASAVEALASDCYVTLWTDSAGDGASNVGVMGRVFNTTPTNTDPTFTGGVNAGLIVLEDASITTITTAMLQVKDVEQAASALTYTVGTAPTKGTLTNNGITVGASGTFTQANIDSGLIKYTPTANANGADSFTFAVADGAGGSLSGQTFSFTITAVNDAPIGLPTISITTTQGQLLTASTSGISDVDNSTSSSLGTISYQWKVSSDGSTNWTNIAANSTSSTYTLTASEAGKYVRIHVSYTDEGGTQETLDSASSAQVVGLGPTVSEPEEQAKNLYFSTTATNNIILKYTASQSATNYLIVRKTGSAPTLYQ